MPHINNPYMSCNTVFFGTRQPRRGPNARRNITEKRGAPPGILCMNGVLFILYSPSGRTVSR